MAKLRKVMRSHPISDLAGGEYMLFVVTRGMSHILMTNGYIKEEVFHVPGRRGLRSYESPYLHHYGVLTGDIGDFLAEAWPRISGIDAPCMLDEGTVRQHAAYLRCLPLFKGPPKQKSWGWWSYGERGADPDNAEWVFRLCDRCRKHYEPPQPPDPRPEAPNSQVRGDLSELLGLDPDT